LIASSNLLIFSSFGSSAESWRTVFIYSTFRG